VKAEKGRAEGKDYLRAQKINKPHPLEKLIEGDKT